MDVLDLGEVLLCHLDQLGTPRLLGQLGGALLLGGRVLIVVPVLLQDKQRVRTNRDTLPQTPAGGAGSGGRTTEPSRCNQNLKVPEGSGLRGPAAPELIQLVSKIQSDQLTDLGPVLVQQ